MFARIFLVLSFCINGLINAQNNLVLLSENGNQFWLYLNEQKINDSAQSIVKATQLIDDTCRVKVVYSDKKQTDFNVRAYFLQNGKSCTNLEFTYAIEAIKGKGTLKFISTNLISIDSMGQQNQASKRVKDFELSQQKEKDTKNRLAENYPVPTPCTKIISDSLLKKQVNSLKANHIDNNRIKDAKWFISNNCMHVSQIEKIVAVFDYEDSKVKLAKFSYDYILDKENFLNIVKQLSRRAEQEELKTFYTKK